MKHFALLCTVVLLILTVGWFASAQITNIPGTTTVLPLVFAGTSPNSGGGLSISTGITPTTNIQSITVGSELISIIGANLFTDASLTTVRNDTSKIAQALDFDNRATQDDFFIQHISGAGTVTRQFGGTGTGSIGIGGNITTPNTLAGAAVIVSTSSSTALMQITSAFTVSALPTCNTAAKGTFGRVSDATAPTYNAVLTGGGAVEIPVYCDGTSWKSH